MITKDPETKSMKLLLSLDQKMRRDSVCHWNTVRVKGQTGWSCDSPDRRTEPFPNNSPAGPAGKTCILWSFIALAFWCLTLASYWPNPTRSQSTRKPSQCGCERPDLHTPASGGWRLGLEGQVKNNSFYTYNYMGYQPLLKPLRSWREPSAIILLHWISHLPWYTVLI